MKCVELLLAGAAALMISGGAAMAQDETPPPCSSEEYRQLDFWVGTWDARWVDADGNEQHGSNVISRELDSCMIFEQFDGRPGNQLLGRSMSIYSARLDAWKQVWMDNQGSYLPFTGGPEGDRFVLTMDRGSEEAPYYRMMWENISEDGFDWRWQASSDEGATWQDQWHIIYSRAED